MQSTALSALLVAAGSILTPSWGADADTLSYGGYEWSVDRYPTHAFETLDSYQGRKNVLHMRIGDSGFSQNRPAPQQGTYYNNQGYKAETGLSAGPSFISGNLYIPSAWQTAAGAGEDGVTGVFQAPALWGNLADDTGATVSWPIVGFSNIDGTGVIRIWDDMAGAWSDTDAVINFGDWNNLRIVYTDNKVQYMINGTVIGSIDTGDCEERSSCSDPTTTTFKEIILNSYNNSNIAYDVYWSNILSGVAATALPIENGTTISDNLHLEGNDSAEIGDDVTISRSLQASGSNVTFGDNVTVAEDLLLMNDSTTSGGENGAVSIGGDALVDRTSTLGGNISIGNDLFLSGVISPGNSPGIATIGGNYIASPGATAVMDVDVTASSHVPGVTHDQIAIAGDVSGSTRVQLRNLDGSPVGGHTPLGDLSTLELVTVGGDLPGNAFALDRRYIQNGRELMLETRGEPGAIVIGLSPIVAGESFVFGSVARTFAMAGDQMLGRFVDRRGYDWADAPRAWARFYGGGFNYDRDTGVGVDATSAGALMGLDIFALPGLGDTRVGMQAGYGYVNADVKRSGPPVLGGDAGSTSGNMVSVGAYLTHATHDFFADLTLQYRFLDIDLGGATPPNESNSGHAVDVAAEIGYKYPASPGLMLVPTAQLLYQNISLSKHVGSDFIVNYGHNDALIGRFNVSAVTTWEGLSAYGGFGIAGNFRGSMETDVSGLTMKSKFGGVRAELTAGLEAALAPGVALSVSGEYGIGFNGDVETYLGKAALNVSF